MDEREKQSSRSTTAASERKGPDIYLDVGEGRSLYRKNWWQLWRPKNPPPPAPASLDDAKITPLMNASFLSMLTYTWLNPIMVLGYQRTLQATDLWKLDESRQAGFLSDKLEASWTYRCQVADEWNAKLASGELEPSMFKRTVWSLRSLAHISHYSETRAQLEKHWREVGGKKEASLAWALNDVFGWRFWSGGVSKVIGDTSQLMAPLLIKAIINFSEERTAAKANGEPVPNIGRGIGMAIGLLILTVMSSVFQHQFFWRSMMAGALSRATLITSVYKRGVVLTPKSRTKFSNSRLLNYISSDISRVEHAAQWFHAAWTAPVQTIVCLIILLIQLGPSALAGFALFIAIIPLQEQIMTAQFKIRKNSVQWTDQRAKQILEILGAMRIVKYFTYEVPFLQRIFAVRKNELNGIRKIQFARSANVAMAFSLPVLAATLAFVTYTGTAHSFNSAIIFSAFSLFQLLRQPMMFLPRALAGITDARSALGRLTELFHAEIMPDHPIHIDLGLKFAVQTNSASFEWEQSQKDVEAKKPGKEKNKDKAVEKEKSAEAEPTVNEQSDRRPFIVEDVSMCVERGVVCAIVGPVGSGKSSLLQGMIGEMRRTSGDVTFGGRVGYCPQTAWIQNATLRDNILFGQPFDEEKYWKVIENASLVADLDMLPAADLTEIGEKGINLSGGQKQRVSIARALYFDADVILLDDPLSAVDSHVGRALFTNAILGALRGQGKTVLLVTHALHFLSEVDYIYTLDNGRIAEHGTYNDLIERNGKFARLARDYGGHENAAERAKEQEQKEEQAAEGAETMFVKEAAPKTLDVAEVKVKSEKKDDPQRNKLEGRLIVAERREIGSVSWKVYGEYAKAGDGWVMIPLILLFIVLMQGSQIINSYTLVWWEGNTFHRPQSFYQILYALLGVGQSVFILLLGMCLDWMGFLVSQNLHHKALTRIFYAPMSYFDTNPLGRIVGIFGKDFDSIDDQLPVSMRNTVMIIAIMFGSLILIVIVEPWFLIALPFVVLGYGYFYHFYQMSAQELKRIDGMLRSILYAHLSESLSGLSTIRSYNEVPRFVRDSKYYIDLEDRALALTVTNQRWMAIRLDFMGSFMVLIIALLSVTDVSGINPAQIGLILTYVSSLVQSFSVVTRQTAEIENYMNAVERVVHYTRPEDGVPQEAAYEKPDVKPPIEWPSQGAVEFKDVRMSYRPGLPEVLKGISLSVQGGEKIGVVGRTGAGKSTLMLVLYRIVELASGSISIDGIDISTLGLRDLRKAISIIPQDPLLFSGTIRSNLDPFNLYSDAHLWDALRRSYLVSPATETTSDASKFTLDTVIESEGANLSVGERSLLSLARALVKDSKVVVLDEATASVDLETDAKIQRTIQTQFHDRTLLCIAHRLRTIINYDRLLVMSDGQIAEFDTPVNLFNKPDGIFRGMCERSDISLADIEKGEIELDRLLADAKAEEVGEEGDKM